MGAAERIEEVDAFEAPRVQLACMEKRLSSPAMMKAEHGEIESYVIEQGSELERLLMQSHMELRGARETRLAVTGADGVRRTTMRESARPVTTLVGEVEVGRIAYQARDVSGLHPMDSSLNLPPVLYLHGVERFVAENAAIMSFDDVRHALLKQSGARVAKRQVEELSVRAAADFETFYAERRAANDLVEPTRDPLVMTFDGKGIVMVPEDLRPATKKAAKKAVRKLATRLTKGEKRNRKRMAQGAAIYTVPRYIREPLDILADLDGRRAGDDRPARPKVRHKRVWASVEREPQAVIEETFLEARARDPRHTRQWAALVDGNKDQLAIIHAMADKHGPVRIVVDLMHVLEYLWRAAHALCGDGTKQAETWVHERLLSLLHGESAGKIATAMRRTARTAKLVDTALAAVVDAADYLRTYGRYMRYDEAIAHGLPVATGVIEGACRYLVKDRMDRGRARWTLTGAEAVLRLRALRASGDFDAYWQLHLREELRRNHAERYAGSSPPDPLQPLRRVK
jgi:hypothetical protein